MATFAVLLFMLLPLEARPAGNYIRINLPTGIRIEIPKNWHLFSKNELITYDSALEATMDLSKIPYESAPESAFGAVLYNDQGKVLGIVRLSFVPSQTLTQADFGRMSEAQVQRDGENARAELEVAVKALDAKLIRWDGTYRVRLADHLVLVHQYVRTSKFSPGEHFNVSIYQFIRARRTFNLTVSYMSSLTHLLEPITKRVIATISVQ